eukprot:gene10752-2840_t
MITPSTERQEMREHQPTSRLAPSWVTRSFADIPRANKILTKSVSIMNIVQKSCLHPLQHPTLYIFSHPQFANFCGFATGRIINPVRTRNLFLNAFMLQMAHTLLRTATDRSTRQLRNTSTSR